MLNRREFELLLILLNKNNTKLSQRKLSTLIDCSLGTVNRMLKDLAVQGYYVNNQVTEQGVQALEPYRVRKAIFIAAGFGSRLAPITLNTPKPLIRVNGKRIIDTAIDALLAQGIEDITIVRGYLGEQFDQLLYKYPMLKFVDNPMFNEANNIASAVQVKDSFANAYVLDADLLIQKPELIRKYEYQSNILGVPVEMSDDWCMTVDKNGYIDSLEVGCYSGYREVGISYWSGEDGQKLAEDLPTVYISPGGKERYWEQVPLLYKKQNYQVVVRTCAEGDVLEIDTLSELKQIDKAYACLG